MDLSAVDLESSRERAAGAKEAEARAEQGADVTLLLSLPGGQKAVHRSDYTQNARAATGCFGKLLRAWHYQPKRRVQLSTVRG